MEKALRVDDEVVDGFWLSREFVGAEGVDDGVFEWPDSYPAWTKKINFARKRCMVEASRTEHEGKFRGATIEVLQYE